MKNLHVKLTIILIIVFSLVISIVSVVAVNCKIQKDTPIKFVLGDSNCDGKVNVVDATTIQKHIAKILILSENGLLCADVNYDEEIKIRDATEIQKWIAKLPANQDIGKELKPIETTILDSSESLEITSSSVIVTNVSSESNMNNTNIDLDNTLATVSTEETDPQNTEPTETSTTIQDTTAGEVIIPNTWPRDIAFSVVEESRIDYYGSSEPELYLVTSREEAEAILSKISGDYYSVPTLDDKYDDTYFSSNYLIISFSCVGGGNCSQNIYRVVVEDDTLTVYRIIFQPINPTPDMNYQYVLIEVDGADVYNVTKVIDKTF